MATIADSNCVINREQHRIWLETHLISLLTSMGGIDPADVKGSPLDGICQRVVG